jgi:hypothetical protein
MNLSYVLTLSGLTGNPQVFENTGFPDQVGE